MRKIVDKIVQQPRRCSWELTLKCNYKCSHCGSAAGKSRTDELSTEEALHLCDELSALGCRQATLLGGEPFLRPDWERICARLVSRGIEVNIVSNGSLIDRDLAKKIRAAGIRTVGISLDGTEAVHNHIRGVDDSFRQCLSAIDNLKEAGVHVCVITVAMERNIKELEPLLKILVSRGVSDWQLQLPVPTGRMCQGREAVSGETVLGLLKFIARAKKEQKRIKLYPGCNVGYFGQADLESISTAPEQAGLWTGCYAGVLLVAIRSNGDVTGCLTMPDSMSAGNVRKDTLKDIWNRAERFAYNRTFSEDSLSGYCGSCQYGKVCRGGCRSMSYYATGSLFGDPYCEHRLEKQGYSESKGELK